jgi:hypothetical protein
MRAISLKGEQDMGIRVYVGTKDDSIVEKLPAGTKQRLRNVRVTKAYTRTRLVTSARAERGAR